MRSSTIPYSGLSWNVQYLGSYSIAKFDTESISKRLDKLAESPPSTSKSVSLTVSLTGVHVTLERHKHEERPPFLSHRLSKVCCVIGRTETCQFAYITREAATLTQHGHQEAAFRRQCHVFRADSSRVVEDIETVLSNAFQHTTIASDIMPFPANPKTPLRSNGMSPLRTSTPKSYIAETRSINGTDIDTHLNGAPLTPGRKRRSFLEKSCRQMSNTTIFQKLFGSTPRDSSTPNRNSFVPDATSTPKAHTVGQSFLRSAQKFEKLTPVGSAPRFGEDRRRKRPVSAVFGQAMYKLSHSATTGDIGKDKKHPPIPEIESMTQSSSIDVLKDCSNQNATNDQRPETNSTRPSKKPIEPTLEFDEKLQEWIYSIGECLDEQLQDMAYFCRNPKKEDVMNHLLAMPEGTFVLRYSESRKRCIALSVRVPKSHGSGSGISHYLIVWNEKGFRIKGSKRFFQSIPMLITHHTVISEQLPCRLVFIELDSNIIKSTSLNGTSRKKNNKPSGQRRNQDDSKNLVNTSASSSEINRTVVKMARRSSSFMIAQR